MNQIAHPCTRWQELGATAAEQQALRPFEPIKLDFPGGAFEARRGQGWPFEAQLAFTELPIISSFARAQALCGEINRRVAQLSHYPQGGWSIELHNEGDSALDFTTSLFNYVPIIWETSALPTSQQELVVANLGLQPASYNVLALMAGYFRLANGFPKDSCDIGLAGFDPGDIFWGNQVRCAGGLAIGTFQTGVAVASFAMKYPDSMNRHTDILMAGARSK